MATTATTTVYQYPYPLGGDSLSNIATRIKELADRSEAVTTQIISGSITLAPGTIYNAAIAATAAISYSKLNLSNSILNSDLFGGISPSKITGTAITAADTGTVTGTIIASSVALGGNPTTTTVTGTTDNTSKIATTGFVQQVATALAVGSIPDGSLTNVKINSAAAIAYSKLNLAASVTSADIVSIKQNQISDFIFTNEAARNAAITSPTEGMRAYLTASTETTAAGTTTAIPTGVQTIYDGSGWVTVTDVGAWSSGTGTRGSITMGASSGGGTDPSVTIRTGTTALVSFYAHMQSSSAGVTVQPGIAVSGATTIASGSDPMYTVVYAGSSFVYYIVSFSRILTGLTAGINTFTQQYSSTAGTTYWYDRELHVKGIA